MRPVGAGTKGVATQESRPLMAAEEQGVVRGFERGLASGDVE